MHIINIHIWLHPITSYYILPIGRLLMAMSHGAHEPGTQARARDCMGRARVPGHMGPMSRPEYELGPCHVIILHM